MDNQSYDLLPRARLVVTQQEDRKSMSECDAPDCLTDDGPAWTERGVKRTRRSDSRDGEGRKDQSQDGGRGSRREDDTDAQVSHGTHFDTTSKSP